MSEGVLESLRLKAIGGYQLAWLQGQLAPGTQACCLCRLSKRLSTRPAAVDCGCRHALTCSPSQ